MWDLKSVLYDLFTVNILHRLKKQTILGKGQFLDRHKYK
jgi:hypothetical protein